MNYEIIEGHGIRAKVYVSDGYLYLNRKKRPKYQKKTMQTRPKEGITYKIQKTPKISESNENTTEKREKHMKLGKINCLRSKTKK